MPEKPQPTVAENETFARFATVEGLYSQLGLAEREAVEKGTSFSESDGRRTWYTRSGTPWEGEAHWLIMKYSREYVPALPSIQFRATVRRHDLTDTGSFLFDDPLEEGCDQFQFEILFDPIKGYTFKMLEIKPKKEFLDKLQSSRLDAVDVNAVLADLYNAGESRTDEILFALSKSRPSPVHESELPPPPYQAFLKSRENLATIFSIPQTTISRFEKPDDYRLPGGVKVVTNISPPLPEAGKAQVRSYRSARYIALLHEIKGSGGWAAESAKSGQYRVSEIRMARGCLGGEILEGLKKSHLPIHGMG